MVPHSVGPATSTPFTAQMTVGIKMLISYEACPGFVGCEGVKAMLEV